MNSLKDLLALDISYYETFSNRIDKPWGTLFINENQPNYYDCNHAHIIDKCEQPQDVINEVIQFYESKKIIPRFYIYSLEDQQELIAVLKSKGFGYEELVAPVQIWDNRIIDGMNDSKVVIEKVTKDNYQEALEIEGSIKEFGGMEVMEKVFEEQFNHPAFTHYLLRYDGKACSTACLYEDGSQARMESVATLEKFRGKGLVGEIIQHVQKEVTHRGINKLWVFPINETIEKVYQKYGFRTVDKLTHGHAFLGGKSISEIRESD